MSKPTKRVLWLVASVFVGASVNIGAVWGSAYFFSTLPEGWQQEWWAMPTQLTASVVHSLTFVSCAAWSAGCFANVMMPLEGE